MRPIYQVLALAMLCLLSTSSAKAQQTSCASSDPKYIFGDEVSFTQRNLIRNHDHRSTLTLWTVMSIPSADS